MAKREVSKLELSRAHDLADKLRKELDQAKRERDAWMETARQVQQDSAGYRKLVVEIGDLMGIACHIQDDGGFSQDVLCAKVVDRVRARLAILDFLIFGGKQLALVPATLSREELGRLVRGQ